VRCQRLDALLKVVASIRLTLSFGVNPGGIEIADRPQSRQRPVSAPRERDSGAILDLLRRNEHNSSISPFRNWIARAPVIANSLLNGVPDGIENSILE
jgi:hypothetical protein